MVLQKITDKIGAGIQLSIVSGKSGKKFINNNGNKCEFQTEWLKTDESSLPHIKYVKDDDTSY